MLGNGLGQLFGARAAAPAAASAPAAAERSATPAAASTPQALKTPPRTPRKAAPASAVQALPPATPSSVSPAARAAHEPASAAARGASDVASAAAPTTVDAARSTPRDVERLSLPTPTVARASAPAAAAEVATRIAVPGAASAASAASRAALSDPASERTNADPADSTRRSSRRRRSQPSVAAPDAETPARAERRDEAEGAPTTGASSARRRVRAQADASQSGSESIASARRARRDASRAARKERAATRLQAAHRGRRARREVAALRAEREAKQYREPSWLWYDLPNTRLAFIRFLLVYAPLGGLLVCAVCGGVLALAEGWDFGSGLLYMVSLVCGLANPLTSVGPSTPTGVGLLLLISMWALAWAGGMISLSTSLAWPMRQLRRYERLFGRGPLPEAAAFGAFALVLLPLLVVAVSFLAGLLLDGAEGWRAGTGGLYVMASLAMLPNPFVNVEPATPGGVFLNVCISLLVFSLTVFMYGSVGSLKAVESFARWWEGGALGRRPAASFGALLLASIPVIAVLIVILGAILAAVEGWATEVGIYFIVGIVCGLGNPIVSIMPTTPYGDIHTTVVAVWTIALLGTWLGLAGALALPASVVAGHEHVSATVVSRRRGARVGHSARPGVPGSPGAAQPPPFPAGVPAVPAEVPPVLLYVALSVPLGVLLFAVVFGGILAGVEGWDFEDGLLYVLSNTLGLPNPLTQVMPASHGGRSTSAIVGALAVSCVSSVMGAVSLFAFFTRLQHPVADAALAAAPAQPASPSPARKPRAQATPPVRAVVADDISKPSSSTKVRRQLP